MFLLELAKGEKAKIIDLSGVSSLVKRRLLDMGIMDGSIICLKCNMPFGGPLMIENSGQYLGIRKSEVRKIRVERVS